MVHRRFVIGVTLYMFYYKFCINVKWLSYLFHSVTHSVAWDSATPWTIVHQAIPSMGFSRQGYWSGLPFPSPGDLPDPGIDPTSPALPAGLFTTAPPGKPMCICSFQQIWEISSHYCFKCNSLKYKAVFLRRQAHSKPALFHWTMSDKVYLFLFSKINIIPYTKGKLYPCRQKKGFSEGKLKHYMLCFSL